MPVDVQEVVLLLSSIAEDANMRVTVKETVKGGLIAGGSAMAGGLLLGPVGIAAGATVGGMAAAWMAKGKFKPVGVILANMDKDQQQKLYNHMQAVLGELQFEDVVALNMLIQGDEVLRQNVLKQIQNYVEGTMQLQIVD